MKRFLLSLALIFISINSYGQYWEIIEDTPNYCGNDVILTNDSSYVVTVRNNDLFAGYSIKLDQQGNILWTSSEAGRSIFQSFDSGYLITSGNENNNGEIRKIDTDGNLEWVKVFGSSGQEFFTSIIEDTDTNIITCGLTHSYQDSLLYVVKTDKNGNLLWEYHYKIGGYSNNHGGFANDIIEFDNNYYLTGYINVNVSSDYYFFLVKISKNGEHLWDVNYKVSAGLPAYDIELTSDTAFVIIGDNLISKLSLTGDTLWCKYLNEEYFLTSIDKENNGYILAGRKQIGGDSYNILVRCDLSGNETWSKTFLTGYDGSGNLFRSVKSTSNGYIACGESEYGDCSPYLRIIKTDTLGNVITNINTIINNIGIYPNPTKGKIKIESNKTIEQVDIIDINGRAVKQFKINNGKALTAGNSKLIIDLSHQAKGIYFIKLIGEDFVSTQKLILE